MKYTCECINSLFFDYNTVKCGCSNTGGYSFIFPFDGTNFNINEVAIKRKELINNFSKGIIPLQCKDCYMLKEDTENTIDKPFSKELDTLFLSNWLHCNCGCIYCCNRRFTKLRITPTIKKSDYYDLLPIIKELCENGYIGKNTQITTVGGEPTVWDEFDEVIAELANYTKKQIRFLSSGIIFSETIYNLLKEDRADLGFSLDCGSPEMYRKIKRIDAFNKVVENITKYASANPLNKQAIHIKYIMVRGLNDNIEEVKNFINIAKQTGVKKIFFGLDYNDTNRGNSIPEHWYDIFEYFMSVKDMEPQIHDLCRQILDKKYIF